MKKWLTAFATLAVPVALLAFARQLYRPYRAYSGNLLVVVDRGMQAPQIANLLVARGVLAHRLPFLIRYALSRTRRRLKAGEYLFDRPLSPLDVYRKLVEGDIYLHAVTIPEGFDRFDMAQVFRIQLGLSTDQFLRVTRQTGMLRDLDPHAPTLEGYLYPDTYRFPRGVSPAAVVETMVARLRQVLDARFHGDFPGGPRKFHDVITLASLVEKETPDPAERSLIAGVFERRLQKGLPLECDPTVIYAARLNHRCVGGAYGPIKRSDLNFDSPYNTYRFAGPPPGPIASPGELSIHAALHPANTHYLYFVSNGRGGHIFARTLAEHLRNVARYRRQVASIRRLASAEKEPPTLRPSKASSREKNGTSGSGKSAQLKK